VLGCAAGFAGADYDLQDALVESTNKSSSKAERHGQNFYDYELAGPVSPSLNGGSSWQNFQDIHVGCCMHKPSGDTRACVASAGTSTIQVSCLIKVQLNCRAFSTSRRSLKGEARCMPSLSSLQLRQVPLNLSSSSSPSEHLSLEAVSVIMIQATFGSLCCRLNPNAHACDSQEESCTTEQLVPYAELCHG
jgi:hypothetical protein